MNKRTYIAIDLKSFYASVECVDTRYGRTLRYRSNCGLEV